MKHGAELYDLFMATRYQRADAKGLKLWAILNRVAASFSAEDERERDGRFSWRSPQSVLGRRPYLRAQVLKNG